MSNNNSQHHKNYKPRGQQPQQGKQPPKQSEFQKQFQRFTQELQNSFLTPDSRMIKADLLDRSKDLAQSLPQPDKKDTVNQVRKYFNQVLGLASKDEDALTIELRMLKARIRYGAGRGTISREFSELLVKCLDTVMGAKPVKEQLVIGFRPFFESLYAYYYFYNPKK